jgi:transposase
MVAMPFRILSIQGLLKVVARQPLPVLKSNVMDKINEKKHCIGVDISNEKLDLALLKDPVKLHFQDKVVTNDFKGFDSIPQWLEENQIRMNDCLFCMEHTGTYGLLFFAWLNHMKISFCVEPALRIKRSLGITRGKNDKVDARRIADYAFTHKLKLKQFLLPSDLLLQVKELLTFRDHLVRISSGLKASLQSHLQYQKVNGLKSVSEDIKDIIDYFKIRIDRIEVQVFKLIKSDNNLYQNYKLATSVKGVAFVIASYMLVTTNNFTSFENGRQYACYSGIAPFPHESGTSIRGKTSVSHLANKKIKTLLSNGANSAVQWDPEIKKYYERKLAEGKDHNLIINSIRCKLVNRVFAVVKRQTPYVNIYQQNFS